MRDRRRDGDDDDVVTRGLSGALRRLTRVARHAVDQVGLGLLAGVPAGFASFVFLELLDKAIDFRVEHAPWLFWLLPIAAFAIVAVYHHVGGRAALGSTLVIEQVHESNDDIPLRMAPLVMLGTVAGHLFGASVGREGTAIQMSASLADGLARLLRFGRFHRRELLVAAVAAGFGSVFGIPVAGAVFALEVQTVGRLRYEAVLAAFTASFAGDQVVRWLGHEHTLRPQLSADVDAWLAVRVAIAGVAFGATAALFVWTTHQVKRVLAPIPYPPVRAAVACSVVVLGTLLVGRDYLSLSLPLATEALVGVHVAAFAWLAKLLYTSLCLGGGLPGGEVTPLFVIGAALGAVLAGPLGLPPALLAGIGFAAVFAGAANTPIACTLMFVELFGAGAVAPAAIACTMAYVCSGHTGIYPSQRVELRKHR
jgi:H+/Cl- antiporter ClcA